MSNFHNNFWISEHNINTFDYSKFGTDEFEFLKEDNRINKVKSFGEVDFDKHNINLSSLDFNIKEKLFFRECQNVDQIIFPDKIFELHLFNSTINGELNTKYIKYLNLRYNNALDLENKLSLLQNVEIDILELDRCIVPNFNKLKTLNVKNIKIGHYNDIQSIEGIEYLNYNIYLDIYLHQYDWKLPTNKNIAIGSYYFKKECDGLINEREFNKKDIIVEPVENKEFEIIIDEIETDYEAITEAIIIEHKLINLEKLLKYTDDNMNSRDYIEFQNIDFEKHRLDFRNIRRVQFNSCTNFQYIKNFNKVTHLKFTGLCKGNIFKKFKVDNVVIKNMGVEQLESIIPLINRFKIRNLNFCTCRIKDLKLISNLHVHYVEFCLFNRIDSYKNLYLIKYWINFEDLISFKYELEMDDYHHNKKPDNVMFHYSTCY